MIHDREYAEAATMLAYLIIDAGVSGADTIDGIEAWVDAELRKVADGGHAHDEIEQTIEEMRRVVRLYDRARSAL